ncbi:hypothetical protein BN946_scf185042.g59 [Trametes cinnabarina]|uniref:Peptidase A1 domain-containing protein n=1 Tax=Pycnoporus cinnabarinus TaxID=5643 RepID=A0A060S403_PYCCI|nr:hypothetical protein BN946_scf185042.g59 [Trametes cinnabarina]
MVSSFGALRALLLAASLSPALSVPHPPAALPWKRNIQNYVDNMLYLDGSKSALYCAVEAKSQTYGASLDNHWGELIAKSDSSQGSTSQITVESVSVSVSSQHDTITFVGEDVEIDYYTTSRWPTQWPSIASSAGVGSARVGIDITNPHSVINKYLAKKWSNKPYYDIFIFYDWMNSTAQQTEIDFAGIILFGSTFDWSTVLDISPSDVSRWGLPDMSAIDKQSYIYLRPDGTFYVDDCLWVNGMQYIEKSRVSGTSPGNLIFDINLAERWSYFPEDIVNALFGSVSGSRYYSQSNYGYYQIPCDTKISFSFTIGNVKYTVIEEALIAPNPWGDQCIGSIFAYGQSSSWDISIGFQFTSAFYTRFGVSSSSKQPYAKLLPLPSPQSGSYGSSSDAWSWSSSNSGSSSSSSSGYSGSGSGSGYSGSGSNGSGYSGSGYSGFSGPGAYYSGSGSGSGSNGWNSNIGYTSATSSAYQATSTDGSSSNNGNYKGGWNNNKSIGYQSQAQPSTTTTFVTVTHTTIGTTTVARPTGSYSGSGSGSSGSGSGSGYSGSGSGSGYSGSGSGSGYSGSGYAAEGSEDLKVAGNAAVDEKDENGNDLNLPHGSIADQLKHCLPAIIVVAAIAGLGLVVGLIICLVRRRRNRDGPRGGSAYSTVHFKDVHEPVSVPLYGAEEGTSRYSDPYKDKE